MTISRRFTINLWKDGTNTKNRRNSIKWHPCWVLYICKVVLAANPYWLGSSHNVMSPTIIPTYQCPSPHSAFLIVWLSDLYDLCGTCAYWKMGGWKCETGLVQPKKDSFLVPVPCSEIIVTFFLVTWMKHHQHEVGPCPSYVKFKLMRKVNFHKD